MKSLSDFIPDRGQLIWIEFNPQIGREQAGRRPALVLSSKNYNARSRLAIVCPVTSQVKGYPFEIELAEGLPVTGVLLCDHVKSLDWKLRNAEWIGDCSEDVLQTVQATIAALIGAQPR